MDNIPTSIRTSTIHIFGVDLVVHHLDNGQRVIEADSMAALFEAMGSEDAPDIGDVEALRELLA